MPTSHLDRSAAIIAQVEDSAGVDPRVVLERGVRAGAQVVVIASGTTQADEFKLLFPQAHVVRYGATDTALTTKYPRAVLCASRDAILAMINGCHSEADGVAGVNPYDQEAAPVAVVTRSDADAAVAEDVALLRGLRGAPNATLVVKDEDEREVMIGLFPQAAVIAYADFVDHPKLTEATFARGPVAFTPGALGALMADLDVTYAAAEAAA